MNFIKLVNGEQGESHKTPPVHLAMLDKLAKPKRNAIANLCFRGLGKTSLFVEYMVLYLAIYRELPSLGELDSMIFIADSMENGAKNAKKNIKFRYETSEFLQTWIKKATFTDPYIEFENAEGKIFGIKLFGAMTGLRGTKIFGKRPKLCILDDLVSDSDSKSQAAMETIRDTIYKGVNHALDPTKRLIVMNGTPFHKEDVMVEAVESGAWDVNVWPVCERFPCSKEEFIGAWDDRFTYDYLVDQWQMNPKAFYQELMLRLTADEERLVQDKEIHWFKKKDISPNDFNYYITTDFATSSKKTADYSVILVWGYSSEKKWYLVDLFVDRKPLDQVVNQLFKFVKKYKPQGVGLEVTGQQGGFIPFLQKEMMERESYFNLVPVRPTTDKLSRFNMVVPWFIAGRFHFCLDLKDSTSMGILLGQLKLATREGIKGKDDCLDAISMLQYLTVWEPSKEALNAPKESVEDTLWDEHDFSSNDLSGLSSYIV